MALVKLENISKIYSIEGKEIRALDNISFEIEKSSFISVVGRSGAGKTTLLRVINSLEKADQGIISFEKTERTGTVFQESRLIRTKTVEKNILLALKHEKDASVKQKRVDDVLKMLDLYSFRHAYPYQLSGGMAQRVSLGRALCREPELLLMDEPFGALDAITRETLQKELLDIYRKKGITIIFITHDVNEAIFLSSRILVMGEGRIADDVSVKDIKDENGEINASDFLELKKFLYNSIRIPAGGSPELNKASAVLKGSAEKTEFNAARNNE